MHINPERYIDDLINIIYKAGNVVMLEYQNQSGYELKDDNSPITKADLKSHRIIVENLMKVFPNFPILSEESCKSFLLKNPDDAFWCIDPIDGTKEFIDKNGEFTINIALILKKKPVLGLVLLPASNTLYYAIKSKGSFKIKNNKKKMIFTKKNIKKPIFAVSRSHINIKTKQYLEKFESYSIKKVGSSVKLCLVAEGEIDCYPRLGPTSIWDIAAGHCILNEAGGKIFDEKNNLLKYDVSNSYLNNNFVAQSEAFLKYVKNS